MITARFFNVSSNRLIYAGLAIMVGLGAVSFTLVQTRAGTVDWLAPKDGATLSETVTLKVSVPDNTEMVYFKVDENRVAIVKEAPFAWDLDTRDYANGSYRLRAAAYSGSSQLGTADLNVQFKNGGQTEQPEPAPTDEGHEAASGHMEEKGVCGESNRFWHPPVINGCQTGHEHGDNPDPHGYFKQAGVPPIDFIVLHQLTMEHDGHHEVGGGYKIQYLDGGTPKDPSDDIRHAYHQVSSARNTGYFTEKNAAERDPNHEHKAFHSAQVQVLDRDDRGTLVFTDVKWVDKVADLHARPSADSPFDKQALVERYRRDPQGTANYIRNEAKKESWYWADWESRGKEGQPLPLWNYILIDRILDSPTYGDVNDPWTDHYTCDAQGGDHRKPGCWATGTLRFTDKMQFRVYTKEAGIYWTDIYGEKVYGQGETKPAACAKTTCVRQEIRALVKRDYIGFPNSPMGDHILRLYDAPGIVYPN